MTITDEWGAQKEIRDTNNRGPVVDKTYWGYVIRKAATQRRLFDVAESVSKVLGAFLIVLALGLWILPNTLNGGDLLPMKIAASVVFFIIGGTLIWSAQMGFNEEMQIDLVRREVRVGQRNVQGEFREDVTLRFSEIGSVYLLRSKTQNVPARLFLRVGNSDAALEVAIGSESYLSTLKERLRHDLTGIGNPPKLNADEIDLPPFPPKD